MGSVGVVEWYKNDTGERRHYFTSSFTTDYAYRYSVRSALTLGLDVMYDGSLERAIKYTAPEDVSTFQKMYMAVNICGSRGVAFVPTGLNGEWPIP